MGTCLYAESPSHSYGCTSSRSKSTDGSGRNSRSAAATSSTDPARRNYSLSRRPTTTVAEKVVWCLKRFAFRGVTPQHEATDLLPKQSEDQVHYSVIFSLEELHGDTEPTR